MLVAAVLRPEEREDGELEVVRIAREERADALVLPVREAECAMERRFRHAAQRAQPSRCRQTHGPARLRTARAVASPRCARYWPLSFLLAAMWGASYLFIKVAVEDIPPAAMTEIRLLVAGRAPPGYLAGACGARAALAELRAAWRPCLVLGIDQRRAADDARRLGRDPHRLEHRGDRPVLRADLRRLPRPALPPARAARAVADRRARASGSPASPSSRASHPEGGWWAVAGTLAVVLSSLSYAGGGVYGQLQVHGTRRAGARRRDRCSPAALVLSRSRSPTRRPRRPERRPLAGLVGAHPRADGPRSADAVPDAAPLRKPRSSRS